MIGSKITSYAAVSGEENLFFMMKKMGYLRRIKLRDRQFLFFRNMGCNSRVAQALSQTGINTAAIDSGGTALHNLNRDNPKCPEMVRTLIGLGVPVNARDEYGYTALMKDYPVEIVRSLLESGADPNLTDEYGQSALFHTTNDEVALLLLRAGADPYIGDKGHAFVDVVKKSDMPMSSAWIEENAKR